MPRKGFKKVVDPFADLPSDWREAVAGSSREEIQFRIAKVALDDAELRRLKKEDEHLKECAEQYKDASAMYREGFKTNKLKIEYMKKALDDKGGPTQVVNHHTPSSNESN
jgi:hypothetical protein